MMVQRNFFWLKKLQNVINLKVNKIHLMVLDLS